MTRLKRHLVAIVGAILLALGVVAYAVVPASAACSGVGIQVNDGSGHTYTFYTTGTCSNPTFGKGDLNLYAATCIGNWGINQGDESDCINQVRFFGSWPGAYAITAYQDDYYGGRVDAFFRYSCAGTAWHTVSHVDEITSFIVKPTTILCT